jgi:hypothetical protein
LGYLVARVVLPLAFRKMNTDLTDCINQLAARAEELGEKSTACVLYSLAAHRLVLADSILAMVVAQQALVLHAALKSKLETQKEDES